jgi:aminoglycoside phosphotransferase (APT) family kinase protein
MRVSSSRPDIVERAADAETPLLVLEEITAFLDEMRLGQGPVQAARLGSGSSNVTFALHRGTEVFVLRRPPRPPLPPSAHDVAREARLQLALQELGVRVPRILGICEEPTFVSAPFYLMTYVEGSIVTDRLPAQLHRTHANRRRLGVDLVDALAEVHAVDVNAPDLKPFHRPGDYLARQVRRFRDLWPVNATRELPLVDELGEWLERTRPEPLTSTVVHGDYRLGNVLVGPDSTVAAILDWEMGAIGDPRADVGYLVATYSDAQSPGTVMELSPATRQTAFPDRREIIARYEQSSGRDVGDLRWFEVLAKWKSVVFLEAIYGRYLRGVMDGDSLAPRLKEGVPALASNAAALVEQIGG